MRRLHVKRWYRWLSVLLAAGFAAGCGGERAGAGGGDSTARATPAAQGAGGTSASAGASDGRKIFARTCATCHQQTGQGMPGTFPPLAGSPYANGDKGRLARIVLHGLQGPLEVHGQRYNNVMAPWKTLSDAEIAAVLTHVRSSFGNSADAVTAGEVARERAATAGRTTMLTVAELGR